MILVFPLIFLAGFCHASENPVDFDEIFCGERYVDGECKYYYASMLNLIATPERFHGKRIRVISFAVVGPEGARLVLSPGTSYDVSVELSFRKDAAQKEKPDTDVDEYKKRLEEISEEFDGRRVAVEGMFNMNHEGTLAKGEIYDISHLRRLWW
jgi:hypothetical protein